jgi:hypothetical protein
VPAPPLMTSPVENVLLVAVTVSTVPSTVSLPAPPVTESTPVVSERISDFRKCLIYMDKSLLLRSAVHLNPLSTYHQEECFGIDHIE